MSNKFKMRSEITYYTDFGEYYVAFECEKWQEKYGADADGNRWEYRYFVDNVKIIGIQKGGIELDLRRFKTISTKQYDEIIELCVEKAMEW